MSDTWISLITFIVVVGVLTWLGTRLPFEDHKIHKVDFKVMSDKDRAACFTFESKSMDLDFYKPTGFWAAEFKRVFHVDTSTRAQSRAVDHIKEAIKGTFIERLNREYAALTEAPFEDGSDESP